MPSRRLTWFRTMKKIPRTPALDAVVAERRRESRR
jgi:hypothetical protein